MYFAIYINRAAVNRLNNFFDKIHFLLISENEFFHEINVTELRDGITSSHGIHDFKKIQSVGSSPMQLLFEMQMTLSQSQGRNLFSWVCLILPNCMSNKEASRSL